MLISLPTITSPTATNVIDSTPLYDTGATYEDKDLVRHDAGDGEKIYGVFNIIVESTPEHELVYYSETSPNAPFDSKQYSTATRANEITYTVEGVDTFDTIAFGKILADTVTVTFKDETGTAIFAVVDHPLNNKIDKDGRHPSTPVTQILYCPYDMISGSTVDVIAKRSGKVVEIGSIMLGLSLEAGFTHLTFKNTFVDYSPFEKDQWGNILYVEGAKVNVHKGTVDLPISDYDYMNRTMLSTGAKTVILNGYGKKSNTPPENSEGSFYATMMIARITGFSLQTNIENNRLDSMATYTFVATESI